MQVQQSESTPRANRKHIGLFGCRNAGKSSLINALTGQDLAIVSPQKGTTTDPVYKAMELLPLGPVVFIDTPGLDDEGELGAQRVQKAQQALNKCDLALLLIDAQTGPSRADEAILQLIRAKGIPCIQVWHKSDLRQALQPPPQCLNCIAVSSKTGSKITELKAMMASLLADKEESRHIIADLISPGDLVLLVTPIDEAAPKGRLILPQQQTIREILDHHGMALMTQLDELPLLLSKLSSPPRLVVTDSQVFAQVAAKLPAELPLTSFSMLFARYKGDLASTVRGVKQLQHLQDGDKLLIAEGCTHHRQCNDIGSVKLPGWINEFTGKKLQYHFCSGGEFPADLEQFSLVIHCGGCMLNEREMRYRLQSAANQGVPISNYGVTIAYMHGILKRSLQVFPELRELL
ncbi:MAG: [FeFe] hydrogenase H-cluster maturation GTPase HydF [Lentisphaeria bacterium]|jgi:[FeFe] hydrogenase H-cluster maturation GTPase HydF|nr:[FeFe] hydrogenase H-cluster maturation GTPase HydF [Lentisphaeria bacterium]MDY0176029.1 [FeFe] hydrogenase H-cluster maturation GTPase HydF [Lentisphaeria bacterium]